MKIYSFAYIAACLLVSNICLSQTSFSQKDFINPPQSVKVHTWWHWMDNAITREGITKDLESMKQQGIAQATILDVSLFNQKDFGIPLVKFNSPEWYAMFQWALQEANRLGITIGVHNCDGWSTSGGPWITPEKSMKQYAWTKIITTGGKTLSVSLAKPFVRKYFYADAAVVAYRTHQTPNSFQKAKPTAILNDSTHASYLLDGDPGSSVNMKKGNHIVISFPTEFNAEKIVIHLRRPFTWANMANIKSNFTLSASDDGLNFTKVKDFELTGFNESFETAITPAGARYFKLVLTDFSNPDSWHWYQISEVELLKKDEQASYSPGIAHLLEKTVAIKPANKNYFNSDEQNSLKEMIPEDSVLDITAYMNTDGLLKWQAPVGNWCIIRFGYTTTGVTNAPANAEGTGLECDKMDPEALDFHFNSFPKKLIDAAGIYTGNTFKFLLVDSWECNYQNWTQSFPKEFEKRRGYDLIKFIPVLCGDVVSSAEQSNAFLYDFRKTIADLIEVSYYKHFNELCHQNKLEFHSEVIYGGADYPPLDILKTNSYVDLPMFEFWSHPNKQAMPEYLPTSQPEFSFPIYSSVLYNKPVIGAEAYTSLATYSESPWYLKSYGDRAFCSGINQMILHSYVHQPADKKPGLTLGPFASHFNRNNPWWQFASGWLNYQSRVQYFLQKGETVSDILFYTGDQLPQYVQNDFLKTLSFGYRANACNLDILKNKASVQNGKIVFAKTQQYSLLVLPDNNAMEWETLQRIAQLIKEGAVIYGPKPLTTFSLKGIKSKSALLALADEVWGTTPANAGSHAYGKGKVYWGSSVNEVLKQINLTQDFSTGQPDSLNLMYIHKKTNDADIYFVANQQNDTINRECIFRVGKKNVEIWNPQYGSVITPSNYKIDRDGIHISVSFQPREALIFVFTNKPSKKAVEPATPEIVTINNFKGSIQFSPAYPDDIPAVDISSFKSYTDFENPAVNYFSGIAKYTIQFDAPANIAKNDSVLLSIGNIEATAELRLNKKWLGYIWMPDFKLKVGGLLQAKNTLEITVANAYRNRIIGDYKQYDSLKNVWTSGDMSPFSNKEKMLKPSGVMGPLQLIIYRKPSK